MSNKVAVMHNFTVQGEKNSSFRAEPFKICLQGLWYADNANNF